MYFELFKPQNWRKRSAEARRRNCAVLPLFLMRWMDFTFWTLLYTTASFHKTLLSAKMAGGQYKLRHPPLLQLNVWDAG